VENTGSTSMYGCSRPANSPSLRPTIGVSVWKSGFDYTDIVKCDGEFFLNSTKRRTSLPVQISTRYLQFGQGEGVGKKSVCTTGAKGYCIETIQIALYVRGFLRSAI
jgi:hypothetical protein